MGWGSCGVGVVEEREEEGHIRRRRIAIFWLRKGFQILPEMQTLIVQVVREQENSEQLLLLL